MLHKNSVVYRLGQIMKNTILLLLFSSFYLIFSLALFTKKGGDYRHFDTDSFAYHRLATNFYEGNTFFEQKEQSHVLHFTWTYSLFVALIYKLCGPHSAPIIYFQIVLSLITGLLLFFAAKRLFNQQVALISFIFFIFNLGFIVFPQFLLNETIFIFLLMLFIERFTAYFKNPTVLHLIETLSPLGLSVLIKPTAFYYIFFILAGILLFQKITNHSKVTIIAVALLSFYTPIITYTIINGTTCGEYIISKSEETNLYLWLWPKVRALENNSSFATEVKKIEPLFKKNKPTLRKQFFNHVLTSPFSFATVWFKGVLKTFFGLFLSNLKILLNENLRGTDLSFFSCKGSVSQKIHQYIATGTTNNWVIVVGYFEIIYRLIIYFLTIFAFYILFRQKKWTSFYFFISYIFYFSIVTGHDGCSRYRMPFELLLILLAAFGLYTIIKRQKKEKARKPSLNIV